MGRATGTRGLVPFYAVVLKEGHTVDLHNDTQWYFPCLSDNWEGSVYGMTGQGGRVR